MYGRRAEIAALAVASGRSYFFGFWVGLAAEEHRVVGVLVVAQRQEARACSARPRGGR